MALALVIIICAAVGLFRWWSNSAREPAAPYAGETFTAFIDGEVEDPGEYRMREGDTVKELVVVAGGFTADADPALVDRTVPLKPGLRVIIPARTGIEPAPPPPGPGDVTFPININTASEWELQALPGIGPSLAKRIIEYRETYGPFEHVSGIMDVTGIGENTYKNIYGLIAVGDEVQ